MILTLKPKFIPNVFAALLNPRHEHKSNEAKVYDILFNNMTWTNSHIRWLEKKSQNLTSSDGKPIEVWEFLHRPDESILSEWARHFRNHYCRDTQIDSLRSGTGHSRAEYLRENKFPSASSVLGPSIRSGDFSEILVADYLEFILGNWVPRTRYVNKDIRDESTKGSDVMGFKVTSISRDSPRDTLSIFEVKAQFSGSTLAPKLQEAIDGSKKDDLRKAESLNAIKQYFVNANRREEAMRIERFQNSEDRPYKEVRGAVAVIDKGLFDRGVIINSSARGHPHKRGLKLLAIHGETMMPLVHELYRRAADEA